MAKKNIGSVNVNLTANATAFQKGFADATKGLKKFEDRVKKTKQAAKGLDRLNETLGESSKLKKSIEILAGAGAVAGLTLVAQQLDKMGQAMAQAGSAFKAGEISAGEFYETLAKNIPLIGQFVTAGRSIRKGIDAIFSDEEDPDKKAKRIAGGLKLGDKIKAQLDAIKLANKSGRASLSDPFAADRMRLKASFRAELTELGKLQHAARDAGTETSRGNLRQLKQLEAEIRAKNRLALVEIGIREEKATLDKAEKDITLAKQQEQMRLNDLKKEELRLAKMAKDQADKKLAADKSAVELLTGQVLGTASQLGGRSVAAPVLRGSSEDVIANLAPSRSSRKPDFDRLIKAQLEQNRIAEATRKEVSKLVQNALGLELAS